MEYTLTRIVVTDSVLFLPGGDVNRWAHRVKNKYTANAKIEAPVNKRSVKGNSPTGAAFPVGSLQRSIDGEVDQPTLRRFVTIVSVDVPYALWVIHGTGRIYSKSRPRDERGRFVPFEEGSQGGMVLPPNFGHGWLRRYSVAGQNANNFLERAFDKTARTHSSLRGYSMIGTIL